MSRVIDRLGGVPAIQTLDDFTGYFINVISSMYNVTRPFVHYLVVILVTLSVVFYIINALGDPSGGGFDYRKLAVDLFKGFFIIFAVLNLRRFSLVFSGGFIDIFSGGGDFDLASPNQVILLPIELAKHFLGTFFSSFKSIGLFDLLKVLPALGIFVIFMIIAFVIFAALSVSMIIYQIEFHIVLFFCTLLAPFYLFKPLRFLAQNVFSAMAIQSVRLGVFTFVVSLGLEVLKGFFIKLARVDTGLPIPPLFDIVLICIVGYTILYMAGNVSSLASSIISGGLNTSDPTRPFRSLLASGVGAAGGAAGASIGAKFKAAAGIAGKGSADGDGKDGAGKDGAGGSGSGSTGSPGGAFKGFFSAGSIARGVATGGVSMLADAGIRLGGMAFKGAKNVASKIRGAGLRDKPT